MIVKNDQNNVNKINKSINSMDFTMKINFGEKRGTNNKNRIDMIILTNRLIFMQLDIISSLFFSFGKYLIKATSNPKKLK